MSKIRFFNNKWLAGLLAFLAWSLVFAIIYAQSPLYTSNQNQYFLHGLSHAGIGYLAHDWLTNTIDPLPVFSLLVQVTYLICKSGVLFYLYYALLIGVYLVSSLGIADILFNLRQSKARSLVFIVLFLGIHSALFHYVLSRVLGTERPFLLEGGVAGQRVLGQVFQPSTFGVFLLLSLYLFLRKRSFLSLLSLAVAVSFHSVYLLSAALLVLGYLWLVYKEKQRFKDPALFGLLALLMVAPVLAYTMIVFKPTTMEITRQVNEILVNFRNPQHAIPSGWFDWSVVVQTIIVLVVLFLIRRERLFPILGILVLGTTLLTIFQVITNNNTLALLYPWRTSVILVPVSTTILLAFAVTKIFDRWKADPGRMESWIRLPCLVMLALLLFVGASRFQIDLARQKADPAWAVMNYVAEHKSANDVYLVPVKMEDFRLATGAPVFVDFKSIPYRDTDVLEWYQRFNLANLFYQHADCNMLSIFYKQGITHVVLPVDFPENCPQMVKIYADSAYRLYELTP